MSGKLQRMFLSNSNNYINFSFYCLKSIFKLFFYAYHKKGEEIIRFLDNHVIWLIHFHKKILFVYSYENELTISRGCLENVYITNIYFNVQIQYFNVQHLIRLAHGLALIKKRK